MCKNIAKGNAEEITLTRWLAQRELGICIDCGTERSELVMGHVITASTPAVLQIQSNKQNNYPLIHFSRNMKSNYARMMDRCEKPTFKSLVSYCGESGDVLLKLHKYMENGYRAEGNICFPCGTEGWCVRYSHKNKRICDIYPENGAFMLHMRIPNVTTETIYSKLSNDAKDAWDKRRRCRDGYESWILFRAFSTEHLQDIQRLLAVKHPGYMKNKSTRKIPTEKSAPADPIVIRCAKCGSVQCIKYGIINGEQRYKCKSCNRHNLPENHRNLNGF